MRAYRSNIISLKSIELRLAFWLNKRSYKRDSTRHNNLHVKLQHDATFSQCLTYLPVEQQNTRCIGIEVIP